MVAPCKAIMPRPHPHYPTSPNAPRRRSPAELAVGAHLAAKNIYQRNPKEVFVHCCHMAPCVSLGYTMLWSLVRLPTRSPCSIGCIVQYCVALHFQVCPFGAGPRAQPSLYKTWVFLHERQWTKLTCTNGK